MDASQLRDECEATAAAAAAAQRADERNKQQEKEKKKEKRRGGKMRIVRNSRERVLGLRGKQQTASNLGQN